MKNFQIKRTLNFRKFSVKTQEIIQNWKLVLPILSSVGGLVLGSHIAKGEGALYKFTEKYIQEFLINATSNDVQAHIYIQLLVPTVFAVILFFCGLSVYGGLICNIIPFVYSSAIGIVAYHFYSNYILKGLAYCVIIIFPYAILSLFSLILISVEGINMSQVLFKQLINLNSKKQDYNFVFYYKNCIKSYLFIIGAVVMKLLVDYLFAGIFSF